MYDQVAFLIMYIQVTLATLSMFSVLIVSITDIFPQYGVNLKIDAPVVLLAFLFSQIITDFYHAEL